MHVAVCCITFQRPDGLRRLLEGLNELTFVEMPEPQITVVVIDNDGDAPMRELVDSIRPTFRWSLVYDLEPAQGLSNARNRSLALVPPDADSVAFIDDDEVPEPVWLDQLLHVARTYRAPIVQGPVRPHFLSSPPRWLVRGRFLELGPYRNGASLHFAATGNSLVDAALIHDLGLRFDARFDRTGGEDQRFFGRAIAAGHRVVTAEHAVVHEWIPESRTTLAYLLKRRFRMGNTLAAIDRIEGGRGWIVVRAVKGVGRIGLGALQTASVAWRGLAGLVAALCNMAWGAGALAGLLGVRHHEYETVHALPPV